MLRETGQETQAPVWGRGLRGDSGAEASWVPGAVPAGLVGAGQSRRTRRPRAQCTLPPTLRQAELTVGADLLRAASTDGAAGEVHVCKNWKASTAGHRLTVGRPTSLAPRWGHRPGATGPTPEDSPRPARVCRREGPEPARPRTCGVAEGWAGSGRAAAVSGRETDAHVPDQPGRRRCGPEGREGTGLERGLRRSVRGAARPGRGAGEGT